MTDDDFYIMQGALFIPSISDSIIGIAECLGYGNTSDGVENPQYAARKYLECVHKYGDESKVCNVHKDRWVDLKMVQIATGSALYDKGFSEMLKEDAIKAGYDEKYFLRRDPRYLEAAARAYNKCIAEHGAENTKCEKYKKVWLKAKAIQNSK